MCEGAAPPRWPHLQRHKCSSVIDFAGFLVLKRDYWCFYASRRNISCWNEIMPVALLRCCEWCWRGRRARGEGEEMPLETLAIRNPWPISSSLPHSWKHLKHLALLVPPQAVVAVRVQGCIPTRKSPRHDLALHHLWTWPWVMRNPRFALCSRKKVARLTTEWNLCTSISRIHFDIQTPV